MRPNKDILQRYVAHCPGCGGTIKWNEDSLEIADLYNMAGQCCSCKLKWSYIVDIDPSGTFGVMGFQCDNEDRII